MSIVRLPPRPAGAPPSPYPGWGPRHISVPLEAFQAGRFPGICVSTGRPATVNLRCSVWMRPSWSVAPVASLWAVVGAIVWFRAGPLWCYEYVSVSLLLLVVALGLVRPGARGTLPVAERVARRVRIRRELATPLGAGAILALGLAYILDSAVTGPDRGRVSLGLAILGGLVAATALVCRILGARAIGVRARIVRDSFGDRWVRVRGAHPAFVAALAADLAARRGE